MRQVKVLRAGLMAIGVIMGLAQGAYAHSFEYSGPALLSVVANGLQVFTTPASTVSCWTVKGDGRSLAFRPLTQLITSSYTGCTSTNGPVDEPIDAQYVLSADGELAIEQPTKIRLLLTGLKCEIVVLAQSSLKAVLYKNVSGVRAEVSIEKLESSASGGLCLHAYTSNKTGKYVGSFTISGGEIVWV